MCGVVLALTSIAPSTIIFRSEHTYERDTICVAPLNVHIYPAPELRIHMTTSTTSGVTASSKRKRSNTPDNLGDSLQLQSSEQVHSEEDDDGPDVHPKKKEKRQDDPGSGASPTSTDRLPPISRS